MQMQFLEIYICEASSHKSFSVFSSCVPHQRKENGKSIAEHYFAYQIMEKRGNMYENINVHGRGQSN